MISLRLPFKRDSLLLFKLFANLCLAGLLTFESGAADQSREQAAQLTQGPRIDFAATNYDFGRIVMGEQVKHEFFFTNSGTEPLVIVEVKSICGCTSAMGLGQVEPGQEGRIPVQFYSSGMDGTFDKSVLVLCTDPKKPEVALHLKGTVWRPIAITPANAAFREKAGSPAGLTRVLTIKNQEEQPLTLSLPRTSHREFTAKLKTITEGQEYQLTVRLLPPLGTGNVFGEVQMDTSSRNLPLLKIPVWAISQGGVLVFPPKLELPPGPLTQPEIRRVAIHNNVAAALELGSPVVSTPGVEAHVTEEDKGQNYTVTLTFAEGYALPPGGAELSIRSNQPSAPEIKVPIVASSTAGPR